MKASRIIVAAVVLAVAIASHAGAVPTLYYDEATYLTALSAVASYQINEGFEGPDWSGVRSPASASSVTSQGLTWTASEKVSTSTGWARTGEYGVFDTYGDPDSLYAVHSAWELVGFGGWFDQTTATELYYYLDGSLAGGIALSRPHQFFGVIDAAGFDQVAMSAPSGHWGADDFTVGAVPEPATLFLLGGGLLGAAAARRRRGNKV